MSTEATRQQSCLCFNNLVDINVGNELAARWMWSYLQDAERLKKTGSTAGLSLATSAFMDKIAPALAHPLGTLMQRMGWWDQKRGAAQFLPGPP